MSERERALGRELGKLSRRIGRQKKVIGDLHRALKAERAVNARFAAEVRSLQEVKKEKERAEELVASIDVPKQKRQPTAWSPTTGLYS